MSPSRHGFLIASLLAACIAPSHATIAPLAADGLWNVFSVDDFDSLSHGVEWIDHENTLSPGFGTPLSFTFTVAAGMTGTLTVVDGGFAGDTFAVSSFGQGLGDTSAVPAQAHDSAPTLGTDFDAALADARFSRGVFRFGPGSYSITGMLGQSVSFDGSPLNATVGALKLSVAPVPEPSTWATLAAGMALVAFIVRRRRG